MLKPEFIQRLAIKQPYLIPRDVEAAVNLLINKISNELANGKRIEIRGFGVFSLRLRKAKLGRNPKTGELISVPQRYAIHFKSGDDMRARVNASASKYKIT